MKKFYSFFAAVVMAASFNAQTVLLNESFDSLNGTGGNDNIWSGNVGTASLADYTAAGWTFASAGGGKSCVKAGSGNSQGSVTTPELGGTGDAVLTFRAGAWNGNNEKLVLNLSVSGGATLLVPSVTLVKSSFTSYTVNITGLTVASKITFAGNGGNSRFFIDDIKIETVAPATPVLNVAAATVEFPQTEVEKTTESTLAVTGENLTEAITYAISGADAADFTVTGDLTVYGGTLTVTFAPAAVGAKTAVLTLTSGDLTKTVTLNGEAVTAGSLAVSNASAAKVNLVKNTVATDELIFAQEAEVTLVNMNGQIVKNAKVTNGTVLNVASLANGVYVVTAVINGKPVSQKIIKK